MVGVNGHDKMKSRLVTGLTTWISIVCLASHCGTNSRWRGLLNVAAVPHRHATTI